MQYFDFSRLITKYTSEFTLIRPSKGSYEGGHYVSSGESKETLKGAIFGFSMSKVYHAGGHLTTQDRHLYMLTPIEGALEGCKVVFDNNTYSIESDAQNGNERYTGVFSYVLRWVNKFD